MVNTRLNNKETDILWLSPQRKRGGGKVQQLFPGVKPDVERVRHTQVDHHDQGAKKQRKFLFEYARAPAKHSRFSPSYSGTALPYRFALMQIF